MSPEQTSLEQTKRDIFISDFRIDKSEKMQNQRREFIKKLITEGYVEKIEVSGNLPYVWVTPQFLLLNYDTKDSFISVIYCYFFDGGKITDGIILKDNITGKKIGEYNPNLGKLKLD